MNGIEQNIPLVLLLVAFQRSFGILSKSNFELDRFHDDNIHYTIHLNGSLFLLLSLIKLLRKQRNFSLPSQIMFN